MFYKLYHFHKGGNICANDLQNNNEIDMINLSLVSSLSDLLKFHKPLSGGYAGDYALLTMNNGDKYYLKEGPFADISEKIKKLN